MRANMHSLFGASPTHNSRLNQALRAAPWIKVQSVASFLVFAMCALFYQGVQAASNSVYLDDLTWTEVRDSLNKGTTTVIIPVGGTEQSGQHMALGKHNVRVHALAGRIAETLGNTLVAPVVSYVPEGRISPPEGHMKFAGTISIPEDAFLAVLAGTARSFKQHGFLNVVFIGDHGGYQDLLKGEAQRLNREWVNSKTRAHFISAYYRAATDDFARTLESAGFHKEQIGVHAGLADTSLMMAVDPSLVRTEKLGSASAGPTTSTGVAGNPAESTAVLGRMGLDKIVEKSVQSIRDSIAARPK